MLRRILSQTVCERGAPAVTTLCIPARRWLHASTRPLQQSKKFGPAAAVVSTSNRVNPASARTRRQQTRRAAPASGATSSTVGKAPPAGKKPPQQHQQQSGGPTATEPQPKRTARGKQQIGRFNRVTAEKGLSFASCLYIIGEGMTLLLAYLLHSDSLPIGETGSWLTALGAGSFVDRFLEVGPTVFGVRLSPRLLLNYLVANACTYPLYRYQYAFCLAMAPTIAMATAPMRKLFRSVTKKQSNIPKAPSPTAPS